MTDKNRLAYVQNITVILDGKVIGIIKEVIGGFCYFPKGSKTGGEIFTTIAACKSSL